GSGPIGRALPRRPAELGKLPPIRKSLANRRGLPGPLAAVRRSSPPPRTAARRPAARKIPIRGQRPPRKETEPAHFSAPKWGRKVRATMRRGAISVLLAMGCASGVAATEDGSPISGCGVACDGAVGVGGQDGQDRCGNAVLDDG